MTKKYFLNVYDIACDTFHSCSITYQQIQNCFMTRYWSTKAEALSEHMAKHFSVEKSISDDVYGYIAVALNNWNLVEQEDPIIPFNCFLLYFDNGEFIKIEGLNVYKESEVSSACKKNVIANENAKLDLK